MTTLIDLLAVLFVIIALMQRYHVTGDPGWMREAMRCMSDSLSFSRR
jgi:hypothetical protein